MIDTKSEFLQKTFTREFRWLVPESTGRRHRSGEPPRRPICSAWARRPGWCVVHHWLRVGQRWSTFTGGWEYPEDIKIYGISAAFNAFDISSASRLAYQKDVPVQINGNDLLYGLFGFAVGNALLNVTEQWATFNPSLGACYFAADWWPKRWQIQVR